MTPQATVSLLKRTQRVVRRLQQERLKSEEKCRMAIEGASCDFKLEGARRIFSMEKGEQRAIQFIKALHPWSCAKPQPEV
jgi:cell division FtsZ-interacting protein ZapD